jgi:hypothetical protein
MTNDDQHEPRRGSLAVWLVGAFVVLPSLYVLSLGPAVWLYKHHYMSDAVGIVYVPLQLLHDNCQPIGNALDRYVELWGGP